ncbi:MAG TPA: siderophore-interacting protein [Acidimicrobiales bacterium]|nr:siderophore-interacting protein [Acidimicrobiales bacterium]
MRLRREPPPLRPATVRTTERLSPRLMRVTFEVEGFTVEQPAASVRLLLPSPGTDELVMPTWNGNEFLLPDGSRPILRTFTPRHADGATLAIDVVLHGTGVASQWAETVGPGASAALSGPGRGYDVDPEAPAYLLGGDETAIPAISQLLDALPEATPTQVLIEAPPDARLPMKRSVTWLDGPVADAMSGVDIAPGTRIWMAGEAAEVQRIRKHLFEERGIPRTQASVRGYWKRGRAGGDDAA